MADSNAVSTSNIWPNYSKENVAEAAKKKPSTLGKDDFFKILVKQISNQDPTQPLQDREFIAQMAQFSSVEQLFNITDQLKAMQGPGLIGKKVSWAATPKAGEKPELKAGVVDSILIKKGVQYAKVGEEEILISSIEKIENAEDPAKPEAPKTEGEGS